MSNFLQDIRYGLRMMWKRPLFTLVAVVAIALGVGANTTIFSVVDVLLLRPFAFERPEEVYMVWERSLQSGFERGSVSVPNYLDMDADTRTLDHLSAFYSSSFNLSDADTAERLEGTLMTPELFDVVGARPALGRAFRPEEAEEGRNSVVVISDGLWRRRFGADPSIIDREIRLNGRPHTVVGVMPPKFAFPPTGGDVWKPAAFTAEQRAARGNHYMRVVGRLRPGATAEQAQAEMSTIAARLAAEYPENNTGRDFFVESLVASYTRGPRPFLTVLLGAVGFVLLLACANVANLLLVRGASRQKEIAIRQALGARRTRLVRQLLTESVMLALIGGALGLLLAVWGIDLMASGVPQSLAKFMPGWENVGLNTRAFYFTLGVSVLTGVVFGLAPALQATKANLNEDLKEGGRTSGGGGRNRLRSALVVSEVTLSLVLLIGAGLMIRSFVRLLQIEPGFNASNVLVLDVTLAGQRYDEPRSRIDFYGQLLQRIEALPGVQRAGMVSLVPLSRSNHSSSFAVEGQPPPAPGEEPDANARSASPSYLQTMNIPLLRGRQLDERDNREDAPRVIVVNETLARRHLADRDPLGQRLIIYGESWEIVGVVGNIKHEDLQEEINPEVYFPFAKQVRHSMSLVVKTTGDPGQLAGAVDSELRALDRDQPIYNVRTMDRVVVESLAPQRVTMGMLGVFAAIALVLAAIGIYAVMSYAVAQRTHEIGVRMALGAQPRDILLMVVRQGMLLAVIGIGIGLVAAYFLMQFMSKILYGVSPSDPLTFGGIALLLAAVSFAANFFPARRATRVDPMVALRYE
jgi:putative ABC transport system permease protein